MLEHKANTCQTEWAADHCTVAEGGTETKFWSDIPQAAQCSEPAGVGVMDTVSFGASGGES